MEAEHQLFTFYDEFCKDGNVEKAYHAMVKDYPIAEESSSENKYRAVLKMF